MDEKSAHRRPWLAGVLQLITPGLGNLYCGRPTRGLIVNLFIRGIAVVSVLALLWLPQLVNVGTYLFGALFAYVFLIVDGVSCARRAGNEYRLAWYNRWYVYVLVVIAVSGILPYFSLFRMYIAEPYMLPLPSNEPTLWIGDQVMADKTAYWFTEPKRGEFIVFRLHDDPRSAMVHRIVGLPGETIEIRSRVVYINGSQLHEPYVRFMLPDPGPKIPPSTLSPFVIPAGSYFVLGDNRDNSLDSRMEGVVPRHQLIGKLSMVYLSWDAESRGVRWDRVGRTLP